LIILYFDYWHFISLSMAGAAFGAGAGAAL